MREPFDPDGPHHQLHGEQERCVVEGRLIDGSGGCTVIAVRDRRRHGWVLYPHGAAGLGVLIADEAAGCLADHIGDPRTSNGRRRQLMSGDHEKKDPGEGDGLRDPQLPPPDTGEPKPGKRGK